MANFDKLIQEIGSRYRLGPKASTLVQETLRLITGKPGGIGAFLNRFKAAGFATEVASWPGGTSAVPLSGDEVEQTLGSEVISEIANKSGISQTFARTILGYAIPRIIGLLAQGGFPSLAMPLSSSGIEGFTQHEAEQIPPSRMEVGGAGPGLGRLLVPGAALLVTLGFLGHEIFSGRTSNVAATQSAPVMAQNAPAAIPHAPSTPARLALSNQNGVIVYSGTVRDDATRAAITGSLKTVFGANKIIGDLSIDPDASAAEWVEGLNAALIHLRTSGSQALFEENKLNVGGTIPHEARDKIVSSLKSAFGSKFVFGTIAHSGAAKAAAVSTPKSALNDKHPTGAPNQPALNLPAIYFASDSARVPPSGKVLLQQAAGLIKQLPAGTVVLISGYTHDAGNPTAKPKLSQRRANAVRQVLVDAGVNPAILSAKGYGSSNSLASENGTMEGRSNSATKSRPRDDRRVELSMVQQ